MTLKEFILKHGKDKLGELVGRFIFLAPEFEEDRQLAREIGSLLGDLDCVFLHESRCEKFK